MKDRLSLFGFFLGKVFGVSISSRLDGSRIKQQVLINLSVVIDLWFMSSVLNEKAPHPLQVFLT